MKSDWALSLTALILGVILSFCHGQIQTNTGAPEVTLANGAVVSGKTETSRGGRSFASFIGIPYGVVLERFQEATPAPAWPGTLNAVTPGSVCVQANMRTTAFGVEGTEDCLNLNVYVPTDATPTEAKKEKKDSKKEGGKDEKKEGKKGKGGLPVMLWIHGGAFTNGAGILYGPKFFMDENVILVTINYRLGIFGFLSTGDEVVPGNNGLKDQVLALKWVQENIKNFGGNPARVTIFGESAGAASVHFQYLSQATNGLFQHAIAQSGSALSQWAYHPNPRNAALKLASFLQCPTTATNPSQITSQEIVACFKAQSSEQLLRAILASSPRFPPEKTFPFTFGPCKESIPLTTIASVPFLTESPWDIITNKAVPLKNVTFVIGVTESEGATIYSGGVFNDPKLVEDLNTNWNTIFPRAFELDKFMSPNEQQIVAEKVRKFYFQDRPISTETRTELMNCYSDIYFVLSVRKSALETAARGRKNPVYLYEYAHHGPANVMSSLGLPVAAEEVSKVGHADEILLQFNFDLVLPQVTYDLAQEEFSKNFVKLWATLAINGKPKHSWGAWGERWRPISREEVEGRNPLKWFRITSDPSYVAEDQKLQERMAFWEQLNKAHFQNHFQPKSTIPKEMKTEL